MPKAKDPREVISLAQTYPGNRHGGDWKINARNLYPFLLACLCLLIPRTESGRLCVEPKGVQQGSRTAELTHDD